MTQWTFKCFVDFTQPFRFGFVIHFSNNNGNNAWRDPYSQNAKNAQESNEWNGVPNENGQSEDSNTWNSGNSNQRYQYRQGSNNYRGSGAKSSWVNAYKITQRNYSPHTLFLAIILLPLQIRVKTKCESFLQTVSTKMEPATIVADQIVPITITVTTVTASAATAAPTETEIHRSTIATTRPSIRMVRVLATKTTSKTMARTWKRSHRSRYRTIVAETLGTITRTSRIINRAPQQMRLAKVQTITQVVLRAPIRVHRRLTKRTFHSFAKHIWWRAMWRGRIGMEITVNNENNIINKIESK